MITAGGVNLNGVSGGGGQAFLNFIVAVIDPTDFDFGLVRFLIDDESCEDVLVVQVEDDYFGIVDLRHHLKSDLSGSRGTFMKLTSSGYFL